MAALKNKKEGRRNLYIKIPDEHKKAIKSLALRSNMTLEGYIAAVLAEAIKNEDKFTFVKVDERSGV